MNVEVESKQCSRCRKNLPLGGFYKTGRKEDQLRTVCKECVRKQLNAWRAKNRDKVREQQRRCYETSGYYASKLKSRYNITLDDYDQMFEQQNGVCKICKLPEITQRLSVDHSHTTNKVRGLLCNRCNIMLGYIEENQQTLQSMINYLQEHEKNAHKR